MVNISIDLGSFSVKFLTYKIEKKSVTYTSSHEVIIDQDQYNIFDENALNDLQLKIVQDYLNEQQEEYSLSLSCPSEYLTTRILELPVNNKKKAKLMLPFQLETDLPYSLSQAHYGSSLKVGKQTTEAFVNIVNKNEFEGFFTKLNENRIKPKLLTSEASNYATYIQNTKTIFPTSFCILDIGHAHTKAYFFINNKLVSTHISYIAGATIDEMISKTYNISKEEASIYKHQNAFFLREQQYEEVSENQKAFAQAMNKCFEQLINDFQRWHIGFRVNHAENLSDIFITGGTSNIKNISTYISDKVKIPVSTLDTFEHTNSNKIDKDHKFRNKFSSLSIASQANQNKASLVNLLTKDFSIDDYSAVQLHSMYYIGIRAAILTLVIVASFSIERIFINKDIKNANRKITTVLKSPALNLTPRLRKKGRSKPKQVLSKLKKQKREITQVVRVIQSSIDSNAIKSLERIRLSLKQIMNSNKKISLTKFQSTSQSDFVAVLSYESEKDLELLNNTFRNNDLSVQEDLKNKTYTITGSDI